jgi:hypothetical protein
VASVVANGVMGVVAYLFFASIASFVAIVPIATLVTTVLCGAVAIYVWYDEEMSDLSTRGWVYLTLGFWAAAGVLFWVACWLANIPFDQALALPEALWQWRSADFPPSRADWARRLFLLAMALGPAVALIAIGSVVRGLVLWISGAPLASAASERTTIERARTHDKGSGTKTTKSNGR